jgi:hypothetical protein
VNIGVAQPRGLHLDRDLAWTRFWYRPVLDDEGFAELPDNCSLHCSFLRVSRL